MRALTYAAGALVFTAFIGLNYYIGIRGKQFIGCFLPLNNIAYWVLFCIIASSYIIDRVVSKHIPVFLDSVLETTGGYYMAVLLYAAIVFLCYDLIRLIKKGLSFTPFGLREISFPQKPMGIFLLALIAGIIIYGTWNARNIKVTHYDLTVEKQPEFLTSLHVVMASDLHLGNIIGNSRLEKMVDMINSQNPDIVLLAGDVIDGDTGPFIRQDMGATFKRLKARYGVYAVLGNHENYGGQTDEIVRALQDGGIAVLRDSCTLIDGKFYLTGREDLSSERGSHKRKGLEDILKGADMSLPVILMDHQPVKLEEAEDNGVDIQFSGHTHRGQLFPNELITSSIYEDDWGYLKKGSLQVIVSSGLGTWGPPIRTGSRSEIVDVNIDFNKRGLK